MRYQIPFSIF